MRARVCVYYVHGASLPFPSVHLECEFVLIKNKAGCLILSLPGRMADSSLQSGFSPLYGGIAF